MNRMKPMTHLISISEAKKILDEYAKPTGRVEKIPLIDADGRILASDIKAPIDVPPFDRAAMDGYAVRASDTFGASQFKPKKLRIIETVHAGMMAKEKVTEGRCTEIATGAPMPDGADAVVMVEDTEHEGKYIRIYRAVHPGENVGKKGEDIAAGAVVLKKNELLNPAKSGVLAALGFEKAKVYAKPKIAVIPSGNEIVEQGAPLPPGKIYDVNSYTLATLIVRNGCIPDIFPVVPDSLENVKGALAEAADRNDLIIISGGSSVGEKDVMVGAIESIGKLLFHGIAVKPGKPTLCGIVNGKMVIGMPGYPTSCLTNGYGLLIPILRKMARLPPVVPRKIRARMARRITSTIGRFQFLPVKLEKGKAIPVFKESGAITSMSLADGYIEIPENVDLVEKGEEVEVILF